MGWKWLDLEVTYMTLIDFLSSLLWVKMFGLSGDLKSIERSFLSTSKVSKEQNTCYEVKYEK